MVQTVLLLIFIAATYVGLPVVLASGWYRWLCDFERPNVFTVLALIGFSFGTASAILALCSILYAQAIGGFPFYDPLLLKIYRWGAAISLAGFGFAIGGIWRQNALRWHAPALSFGMLLFWVVSASGE